MIDAALEFGGSFAPREALSGDSEEVGGVAFDLEAAFPSIYLGWPFKVLAVVRLPRAVRAVAFALFARVEYFIQISAKLYLGFESKRGPRQGCPLSGLLLAFAFDPLLRALFRLQLRVPAIPSALQMP